MTSTLPEIIGSLGSVRANTDGGEQIPECAALQAFFPARPTQPSYRQNQAPCRAGKPKLAQPSLRLPTSPSPISTMLSNFFGLDSVNLLTRLLRLRLTDRLFHVPPL
ncbi:hypothetical protein M378DRAFT_169172 [Amanita muscaria Koide BX008]|uniref:Uncharacterized protein n=1 Tax=Amanita muscaria (strain Koide BX008) TaxID=946122 RepID=A0A0C2WT82_AMAMK|nr:hypothetical protein M378DRAFT_169172 [Amanita muscaria Koide BX008]